MARRGLEVLAGVSLFTGLPERHLRKIRQAMTEYAYEPGATIVREGDPGQILFVIVEGRVRVTRGRRTIARLDAGDVFGEIAVLDERPRTASVVAATAVRCLLLHRRDLRTMALADPQLAWNLLVEVAGRLRARD